MSSSMGAEHSFIQARSRRTFTAGKLRRCRLALILAAQSAAAQAAEVPRVPSAPATTTSHDASMLASAAALAGARSPSPQPPRCSQRHAARPAAAVGALDR